MIFRNKRSSIKKTNILSQDELIKYYGLNSYEFTHQEKKEIFVCSKVKEFDLIELDAIHIAKGKDGEGYGIRTPLRMLIDGIYDIRGTNKGLNEVELNEK